MKDSISDTCPFCDPSLSDVIASSCLTIAIKDRYPVSRGHALVIPRRHIRSWFLATTNEQNDILQTVNRVREILDSLYSPNGYNLGINDGEAAGQTVMHLHMHVIPRYTGDSIDPRGGIRLILPDKARYWE